MIKYTSLILPVVLALSGCGQQEVKTVDYYKEHQQERIELLKKCRNSISDDIKANCVNASKAKSQISLSNRLKH